MKIHHFLYLLILFFSAACASTSSYSTLETSTEEATETEESTLFIPAGVDSITAAESDQIADSSFVSFEDEQKAQQLKMDAEAYIASSDTLWYYLMLENPEKHFVSEEDSIESIRSFNKGVDFFEELQDLSASSTLTTNELESQQTKYLNSAISAIEESLELDPFENETRLALSRLYRIKADRLQNDRDYQNAIDVLEKLVRLDKGEPLFFELLGDNYSAVGNYPKSAEYFERARQVREELSTMTDFYFENDHISPQDSTDLFLYAYYEGEAYTNYLNAAEALEAFRLALEWAPTDEDRLFAREEIKFINWDDGNIQASFARDSLAKLVQNEKLAEAEAGFLSLKNRLKTQKARDEIDWRLAVVEYQLEKEEEAAERLLNLVQRTQKGEDGMPVDSTYDQYFSDFGLICFNIGQRHYRDRELRTALKYLKQSVEVKGEYRARANLQLADILKNNIAEAIEHAKEAEREINLLSKSDTETLYSLLTDLYRRDGNLDEARHYRQLWSNL